MCLPRSLDVKVLEAILYILASSSVAERPAQCYAQCPVGLDPQAWRTKPARPLGQGCKPEDISIF